MADNRPWSRGDLALRIADGEWESYFTKKNRTGPSVGQIYQVTEVHTLLGVTVLGFEPWKECLYCADAFRRIDPLSDQEEAEFRSDLANDRVITLVERA